MNKKPKVDFFIDMTRQKPGISAAVWAWMITFITVAMLAVVLLYGCSVPQQQRAPDCVNGYDRTKLTDGILELFVTHGVLGVEAVDNISKEPLILGWCESLLHHMILRQVVTQENAKAIVAKAKQGEAHDPLMILLGAMEVALNGGYYGKLEGQRVIDSAKCVPVETDLGLTKQKAKQP